MNNKEAIKKYCLENLEESSNKGFYSNTAKQFGTTYEAVRWICRSLRKLNETKHEEADGSSLQIDNKGDDVYLHSKSTRIKTIDQLIESCKIDLSIWEVERFIVNKWEVGSFHEVIPGVGKTAIVEPLYQVKAWLKKKKIGEAESIEKAMEKAIEMMNSNSPVYKPKFYETQTDPHLLLIDVADLHIGKYTSSNETGENYNIKIAVDRAMEGVVGIINKSAGFNIDKVCLTIGNDILHIDNPKVTTTSGTLQNTDGMWHEMFDAALELYINMVNCALEISPVFVVYNPSNHDYASGYMLAQALKSWFKDNPNVTFDASIKHRKYFNYGSSLICSTHGDGAKAADMPMIMANEAPNLWAQCKHRYVYLHHIHHKVQTKYQSGKDYHGVTVEYVRSPSASDSWHDRNGYTGVPKAIEGFIHSMAKGQVSRITHIF